MEFCGKCEGLMVPKVLNKKTFLVCRNCGTKKGVTDKKANFKLKGKIEKEPMEEIVIVESDKTYETLPKTKSQCPKCENFEAFWWIQQTRSGDEAPTRFLKCTNTKCGHKWREYD